MVWSSRKFQLIKQLPNLRGTRSSINLSQDHNICPFYQPRFKTKHYSETALTSEVQYTEGAVQESAGFSIKAANHNTKLRQRKSSRHSDIFSKPASISDDICKSLADYSQLTGEIFQDNLLNLPGISKENQETL